MSSPQLDTEPPHSKLPWIEITADFGKLKYIWKAVRVPLARRASPPVRWQSSAETGLDIAGVHVPNRYCSFSHWSVMTSSSNYPGRHKLPPSSHTKNTMIWSAVQCMQRRTAPDIKDPLPIYICTWFLKFSSLKYRVWWTWLLSYSLNWIFLPAVACKIQVWNKLRFKLIKLDISN